jgi:ribosome recycling factor
MLTTAEAKTRFQGAIDHFQAELKKLRTGRPTPEMFENIQVEAYGSTMQMSGVANINTLVTIQPWDKTLVEAIVKAIQSSDQGFNPQPAGDLIRVPIPAMTEEKRLLVVKQLKEMAENYRIEVRVIRKDAMAHLDEEKKENIISEDVYNVRKKELQAEVDRVNEQIDTIAKEKEASLLKL